VLAASLLGTAALGAGACSEPDTGRDSLATGRERVSALVTDAARAIPVAVDMTPPSKTGEVTCRKRLLGYAIGTTGAHRVEVPLIVDIPEGTRAETLLPAIEEYWREQGYEVDRSDADDSRYPKLRAHVDGYEVVATAFRELPRVTFYAVSPCLEE
jgi:hypothetical protein